MSHQTAHRLSISRRTKRQDKICVEEFQFRSKCCWITVKFQSSMDDAGILLIMMVARRLCLLLINANRAALQLDKSSLTPKRPRERKSLWIIFGESVKWVTRLNYLQRWHRHWQWAERDLKFNLIYWDGKEYFLWGWLTAWWWGWFALWFLSICVRFLKWVLIHVSLNGLFQTMMVPNYPNRAFN